MKSQKAATVLSSCALAFLLLATHAAAFDYYLSYGFSETNKTADTLTYDLPYSTKPAAVFGPTQVIATLSLALSNGSSTGNYEIDPTSSNSFIQYSYLGTVIEPTLVDAGVDIGQTLTFTNPSNPNSGNNTFPEMTAAGPSGIFTQLTIETSFTLTPGESAVGSGSFEVVSTPEPSTRALLFGGVGALVWVIFRRKRALRGIEKQIKTLPSSLLVVTAIGFLLAAFPARAQILASDPSEIPTMTLNDTVVNLASSPVPGEWMIVAPQLSALSDLPAGSVLPVDEIAADDPYLSYGFTVTNTTAAAENYTMTFTLPTPQGDIPVGQTLVNSTFAASLTNGSSKGVYSLSLVPTYANIQYSYLGTAANPLDVDAGVDVGKTIAFTGPPNSGSESFTAGTIAGPDGPFSQLTIVTRFSLLAGDTASVTGSFNVLAVPEPRSFLLALLAAFFFIMIARAIGSRRSGSG